MSPPWACTIFWVCAASSMRAFKRSTSWRKRCISAGPAPLPVREACASRIKLTMRLSMARNSCWLACTACVWARLASDSAVSRTVSMRPASSVSSCFSKSGKTACVLPASLRSTRLANSLKRFSRTLKAGACFNTCSWGADAALADMADMRSVRDLKLSRLRFSAVSMCSTMLRTAFSSAP